MRWRGTQAESRRRYLEKFDEEEVGNYEKWVLMLTDADNEACLSDIGRHYKFDHGMSILDAGAGTGALCRMLIKVSGLNVTALEPAPAMIARLKSKPELDRVQVVKAFCDSHDDADVFSEQAFDAIISRQLVNGLFDPLTAFRNWHRWLKDGGSVIVLDGLYDRTSWTGKWEDEIDVLPLSVGQSMALVPYLLEMAGFTIEAVDQMEATNAMPSTRTKRYMVLARK